MLSEYQPKGTKWFVSYLLLKSGCHGKSIANWKHLGMYECIHGVKGILMRLFPPLLADVSLFSEESLYLL